MEFSACLLYVANLVCCWGGIVFAAASLSAVVAPIHYVQGVWPMDAAPWLNDPACGAMDFYCRCTSSSFSRFHHALEYVLLLLLFCSVTIRALTYVTTPVIPCLSHNRFVMRAASPMENVFVVNGGVSSLAGAASAGRIRCINRASCCLVFSMIRCSAAVDSMRRIHSLVSLLIRLSSSLSAI